MPIFVVCPKCRARFQVSEKYAGLSGPCPKCKATIKIPTASEEVKIHGGEEFEGGGRGKLVLKPIARKDTKLTPVLLATVAGTAITMLLVAWLGGRLFEASLWARIGGLLVVTPVLTLAGYTLMRDDELEPHRGWSLAIRVAACSLVYIAIWGLFKFLGGPFLTGEIWNWLIVLPPMFFLGSLTALASFDLEAGNAFFHYSFYVLVVVLLRWLAGMGWIWTVAGAA